MKSKLFGVLVCVALLNVRPAGATTYNVNNTPGNVLGVTGFITTDGNTGFLSSGDIIDWSLTIPATNGGTAFTLTNSNSSVALGSNLLAATSTMLSFNFSSPSLSSLSFQNAALQYAVIWFSGIAFSGGVGGNQEIGDGSCSLCFANSPPFFGTEIIGTVPLPAALPLFASGLGVLGLLAWRRKSAAA
ncbi:MAG TPA: VPLPA-CTERM sorting domain-containing protein [Pirellulales bacterium]|jgi:hypothetical protein